MIAETYTGITSATAEAIIELIEADGGTFERQPQLDGTETIVASYADKDPPATDNSTFPWMPIAEGELGIHEGLNTARITEYFRSTVLGPMPDSVPWCSAFVNFCVEKSGQHGTRSALARSWLKWGDGVPDFQPGCIVVLARGGPTTGHVGFFVGFDPNGNIRLLGGNQHDSVNVSSFPNATVLGRRIISNLSPPLLPPARAAADDPKSLLIQTMDAHNIADNELRAGIAAIAGGESGMVPHSEIGYGHTDPARTRRIFKTRLGTMPDEQILALARDDRTFFNLVYDGIIGNHPGTDDGFNYRGRGIFQLTGRENYRKYGAMLNPAVNLEGNPELANGLKIAVEVAVIYMLDRYPGHGGFPAMKAAVGNSIGPPDANKDQLFQNYLASGEFA